MTISRSDHVPSKPTYVTVTEFRMNVAKYLNMARSGMTVVVTRRGNAIARLEGVRATA